MLSKKYYNKLAIMIAESHDLKEFVDKLVIFLKTDNPKFDEDKFMLALC